MFYGIYYGVLGRDIAEICSDSMASKIGVIYQIYLNEMTKTFGWIEFFSSIIQNQVFLNVLLRATRVPYAQTQLWCWIMTRRS